MIPRPGAHFSGEDLSDPLAQTDRLKAPSYRFTIIIPLEFHRGQIEACLQRWTHEQTYPRDRYEVIAAGCRSSLDQEMLSILNNILGPHDRLLLYDEPHDMVLCAHAAGEARGEALFFTESHCLPESNALTIADETLRTHPEWAGFSCKSLRITHNPQSIVEADMYEADIRYGMQEHPWRKILDQCFVVRTESYMDSGGFRAELGHFAEWHLAAQMHKKGYLIGYAPDVQVWHYYIGDFRELVEFSLDFAQGEMTFLSKYTHDPCYSYFQEPGEWLNRYQWVPRLSRGAFLLAWQSLSRSAWGIQRPSYVIRRYRALLTLGIRAYCRSAPELLLAVLRFQLAFWGLRIGLLLGVGKRFLLAGLLRLISVTLRLERIRFVRRWLSERAIQNEARPISATPLIWRPDISHTFPSIGFQTIDEWNGRRFRWTKLVGMIEVSLSAGSYCFALEWLPVKNIENLIVYLDEKPMPITQEDCKASGFFTAASDRPLRFSWTCEPSIYPGDPRLLGLPVVSISWTPIDDTESSTGKS